MMTKWTSQDLADGKSNPFAGGSLDEESVVLLLFGKNSFGDKVYSYLQITLGNMKKLKAHVKAGGGFNPSDFGTVLAAGRDEPTAETKAEMAALYPSLDAAKSAAPAPAPQPVSTTKKNWDEY